MQDNNLKDEMNDNNNKDEDEDININNKIYIHDKDAGDHVEIKGSG